MIDPEADVFPMVGPGMGYKEMLTGDYIKARKVKVEKTEEADMEKVPDLF